MKFQEIISRLTGFSTPIFGAQWNPPELQRVVARRVIAFLEDRRVLFVPSEMESPAYGDRFTCDGHPHTHTIHDWEVQAAYRHYKHRYGDQALDRLKQEYAENIPARNLHFLMGTIAAHPRNFIIIGLLRSSFDPQELARQGQLF
jgi:hypothetical protein